MRYLKYCCTHKNIFQSWSMARKNVAAVERKAIRRTASNAFPEIT
jgi:hypothetical protein